jgi:hypothetical protein
VIEGLTAELDTLVDVDPAALADSDTILGLHRQIARLEAVTARATARWDADTTWARSGAKSGGAWLAAMTRAPRVEMNRRLRLGRALRHLPHTEQAWLAGDIGAAQVSALAGARAESDQLAHAMTRDEAHLVRQASTSRFRGFQRHLDYWRQTHDPAARTAGSASRSRAASCTSPKPSRTPGGSTPPSTPSTARSSPTP